MYTHAPSLTGRTVVIVWFHVGRRAEASAPYERTIAGYCDLDRATRAWMELFVDEHLTEGEALDLARYLRDRHDLTATWTPKSMPFQYYCSPEDGRRTQPYNDRALRGVKVKHEAYWRLNEEPDYTLGFPVWGVYDPTIGRPLGAPDIR